MAVQTIDLLKTPTDRKKLLSFVTKDNEVLLTEGSKPVARVLPMSSMEADGCLVCTPAQFGPAMILTRHSQMSFGQERRTLALRASASVETPRGFDTLALADLMHFGAPQPACS